MHLTDLMTDDITLQSSFRRWSDPVEKEKTYFLDAVFNCAHKHWFSEVVSGDVMEKKRKKDLGIYSWTSCCKQNFSQERSLATFYSRIMSHENPF